MRICTIGFSGKSAEKFFGCLRRAGVQKLIDIRRSNNTLYCGFTRMRDLPYFLRTLCDIEYVHEPEFAPSLDLLRDYQHRAKSRATAAAAWDDFVNRFTAEIVARPVLDIFRRHASSLDAVCLLCTEATPDRCHRRLIAEYLQAHSPDAFQVEHL